MVPAVRISGRAPHLCGQFRPPLAVRGQSDYQGNYDKPDYFRMRKANRKRYAEGTDVPVHRTRDELERVLAAGLTEGIAW